MARNFTREIRKALRPGLNRAVCSSAPYVGHEVEYAPRNRHDSLPWILVQDGKAVPGYRFTGRECHVQTFRFAVVERPDRLGFVVLDTKNAGVHSPILNGVEGVLAVDHSYSSRYAATDAAKRLEKLGYVGVAQADRSRMAEETVVGTDGRRIARKALRRDFTVTVGSHPHYFNDRDAAESFADSYGVTVTDNRKGN
jgi:hypothetical protein